MPWTSPGDLPNPGMEPGSLMSPALSGGFFITSTTWEAHGLKYPAINRNAFEYVLMRWMKLEPIIQREESQKEKDKYCILAHVYGI